MGTHSVNVLYHATCLTYPFQEIREPCVDVRLQHNEERSVEVDKNNDHEVGG